jgi:hypothetical protein
LLTHAHNFLGGVTGIQILAAITALAALILLGAIFRNVRAHWSDFKLELAKARIAKAHAESKLASVGYETPVVVGVSNGDFGDGFSWHLEIAPDPDDPWKPLKLVRVTVTWDGKRRPERLTKQTRRFVARK